MKLISSMSLFAACLMLVGCGEQESPLSMPGSDEDAHGCKASAGYQWCETTQQCERPWELAEKEGFENTAEAFEAYCGAGEGTEAD